MTTSALENSTELPADLDRHSRRTRCRRATTVACAVLALGFSATALASTASAGTAWTTSGVTGTVREASVPATCFNSSVGYYVQAAGPSAWAVPLTNGETQQYVRFLEVVKNTSTGAETSSAWSAWALATTTNGVTLPNQVVQGVRNTVQVFAFVQWWSPSYNRVIGTKAWAVTSYYIKDQGRFASSC